MSVYRSKRKLSNVEFISCLQSLEKETLEWCRTQGRKNDNFGLSDLFNCSKNAYVCAVLANKTFLSEATLEARRKYFTNSIKWLRVYNSQLVSLEPCFDISNTRIKRWNSYIYKAINQMGAIIKSDELRVKKSKTKK